MQVVAVDLLVVRCPVTWVSLFPSIQVVVDSQLLSDNKPLGRHVSSTRRSVTLPMVTSAVADHGCAPGMETVGNMWLEYGTNCIMFCRVTQTYCHCKDVHLPESFFVQFS